jgi:hypothetical protein
MPEWKVVEIRWLLGYPLPESRLQIRDELFRAGIPVPVGNHILLLSDGARADLMPQVIQAAHLSSQTESTWFCPLTTKAGPPFSESLRDRLHPIVYNVGIFTTKKVHLPSPTGDDDRQPGGCSFQQWKSYPLTAGRQHKCGTVPIQTSEFLIWK